MDRRCHPMQSFFNGFISVLLKQIAALTPQTDFPLAPEMHRVEFTMYEPKVCAQTVFVMIG
jgi:hypothetical protein